MCIAVCFEFYVLEDGELVDEFPELAVSVHGSAEKRLPADTCPRLWAEMTSCVDDFLVRYALDATTDWSTKDPCASLAVLLTSSIPDESGKNTLVSARQA